MVKPREMPRPLALIGTTVHTETLHEMKFCTHHVYTGNTIKQSTFILQMLQIFILLLDLLLLHANATNRDVFVGLGQHGNEHVDEHYDHTSAVRSKHEFSDKLCQIVSLIDRKDID